ncbi:hypothetical protein BsWGS_05699 [Bradybaena similaris]
MIFSLIIASILAYYFLSRIIRSLKVTGYADKYVFITGCDTGFGRDLAQRLDSLGFHVFAGCLTLEGSKSLTQTCSSRFVAVTLDVSKPESIASAVTEVRAKIPGDRGLWALVNNAGIGGPWCPSEMCCRHDYISVFEVNILGLVETTRLCLPLLRKARGRVVNMASAAGFLAFIAAPYACSKFAVEAYSDVLRRETAKSGIKVAILEPGVFRTEIFNVDKMVDRIKISRDACSKEVIDYFGPDVLDRCRERLLGYYNGGSTEVRLVVDAYTHAVTARYPLTRYTVGTDCKLLFRPLAYLPDWFVDLFISVKVYPAGP